MRKEFFILFVILLTNTGCRLIDDDLSVCGTDDYLINYQMRLVTNVSMTIDEKLSSEVEKPIADALKIWTKPIFSGHAHDLDMSFFSLDGTDELKHHWFEIVDASRKSYTLTIPREDYMHLAVVNITDNDNVTLTGSEHAASMRITQRRQDTLPSHATAVYSARLPMHMTNEALLSYDVHLYMVSCAVAVVVMDSTTSSAPSAPVITQMLLKGTATKFNVSDSIFTFNNPSVLRAEKVTDRCYALVSFPSADATAASVARKPGTNEDKDALWQLQVYTQLQDGTVTETDLNISRPLKAGTMEIIKVYMHDNGGVSTDDVEAGISVHLDWKSGSEHDVITG